MVKQSEILMQLRDVTQKSFQIGGNEIIKYFSELIEN
jgi:hypothetical protein